MKEEQGMRKAMLGWWAFLCSCLTTGSEEGLLEEDFDVSLVAGVGVHLGKVLDFPLFLLG